MTAVTHIPVHPPNRAEQIPAEFKSSLNPARAVPTRHQTVRQTALAFEKGSADTYGRLNPSDWRLPRFDFRLTKSSLHRALGFMDELVKLLEANGIGTKTPNDERHLIQFDVEGEQIRVSLREPVRGRKRDLTTEERRDHERYPSLYSQTFRWAYDSTGRLTFEIDNYSDARRKWTDTKNKKLEGCTHEIVYALRATAAYEKRKRIEREAERERQWIEQKRRMKQQERIDRLKRNIANWEEAERIRTYLAAVREKTE